MITLTNDIKRHFQKIGLFIKIKAPRNKTSEHARHIIEVMPGGSVDLDRSAPLLQFYFNDLRGISFDRFSVLLTDFKTEGYPELGICKKCGCSQNDACYDDETGSCWWVMEDLCSACATEGEKQIAKNEMQTLFNKVYE